MNTIELFSGTKSFSKAAKELGHSTMTFDNQISNEPDFCKDILAISRLIGSDVLWASPPCTCFSVASISTHWTGGFRAYEPKTKEAKIALKVIQKTIDLIKQSQPKYWFIENPRGVLRKLGLLEQLGGVRHTVTYCQYGDTRMKPTDIWTNCKEWTPRPMCKNGDKCHDAAPRGSKTGTQGIKSARDRGVIPPELFYEIFSSLTPHQHRSVRSLNDEV